MPFLLFKKINLDFFFVIQIRLTFIQHQAFADIIAALWTGNLQLIQDVVTQWSSTVLMIERALTLRKVFCFKKKKFHYSFIH